MLNHNQSEFHANNNLSRELLAQLKALPPNQGAVLLAETDSALAFEALSELNPSFVQDILAALPDERRRATIGCAPPEVARQWECNGEFEAGTIGRFMEPAYAEFRPGMTVGQAIEKLRTLVKTAFITVT